MVESSKILTVSYGTFSCTLEGFDDSFATMKAIAEYFRDLAAGDRYFGAEPPAPDAEMLTKIAEREISRRVEAHSDENGITLRAGDALGVAAPVAAAQPQTEDTPMPPVAQRPDDAPDMETTQAIAAATADDEDVSDAPAQNLVSETAISDVDADDEMDVDGDQGLTFAEMAQPLDGGTSADGDSVAAKLMRIRAVVGTTDDDDGYIEDLSQQTNIEDAFEEETDDQAEADTEAEAAALAEAEAAAQAESEAAAQAESEAAAQAEAEAAAQAEAEAAAQAEAEAAAQAEAEAAAQAEAEAAAQAEAEAAAQAEAEAAAQAEAEAAAQAAAQAEATSESPDSAAEPDVPKPTIRARILRLARPTLATDTDSALDMNGTAQATTDAGSDNMIANIAAKAAFTQKQAAADDVADVADDLEPLQLSDADAIDSEDTQETSVADRIAAMNLGSLDQSTDDTADADEVPLSLSADDAVSDASEQDDVHMEDVAEDLPMEGSLSEEDEADLQQELADVALEEAPTDGVARQGRDILPETDDAALTRIMGQADEQLSEPEGNRRRNAIAQLKAAVAATEAARQLGDNTDDKRVQENAFREDFKEVVRPTPASAVPRTEVRRERPRPTPLKLVASQRVDAAESANVSADAAPVQPRRIAATTAQPTDADNFAEFATEMGATELPDLLEAAAAYIAYVEGGEDFSRPQIIQKVQATTDQAFSREDGLRSFGTLLRQGRISKVRNGRFQVSDQTRFKPDQKAG